MADQLRFDVTGRDVGAGTTLRGLSRDADVAAASTRLLAEAQQKQRKASDASAAATLASAKADKILRDASDEAIASVVAQRIEQDKLAKSSKNAAGSSGIGALASGGGGLGGGGAIGALIAAGAVLSPIIVTLGTGLAGLGAAAYGIAKPIENAAQKTGGLQKNMHLLNAEQQQVARGVLALGKTFGQFEHALQPVVLSDFNAGLRIARNLLSDVAPVAKATGLGLHDALDAVDKEFQSGTWKQFFGFMAKTARPDIQLLAGDFVQLLHILPPLVEGLQPVAVSLLKVVGAAGQVANVALRLQGLGGDLSSLSTGLTAAGTAAVSNSHKVDTFSASVKGAGEFLFGSTEFLAGAKTAWGLLSGNVQAGTAAQKRAAPAIKTVASALAHYKVVTYDTAFATGHMGRETDIVSGKAKIFAGITAQEVVNSLKAEAKQLNVTAGAYEHALTPLENYISANLTEANDLHALRVALRASGDAIGYKTQKERDSFSAAQTYIQDTLKQGNAALSAHRGIDQQIRSIENALPQLEHVKGKTASYRAELELLKGILDKLRREKLIQEQLRVTGTGEWHLTPIGKGPYSGKPVAAGWRVTGGVPGQDSVPLLAMPGETVLSVAHSAALAPLLKRIGVPGFAAGGVVPSYSGPVAGLPPWTSHNQQATITALTSSIGNAMAAAFKQQAMGGPGGTPGPGGGSAAANAALAYRLYAAQMTPAMWVAWNYVAMRESGWNQFARNPSSGAYGIAQALPPTKYPFAGQAAGGSNPMAQITWMWNYMRAVYGGPAGAAAHERAFNWYGSGVHRVFRQPTVIGVGEAGPERVDVTPLSHGRGSGGSGALVHVENMTVQNATDLELISQRLSFAITAASLGS